MVKEIIEWIFCIIVALMLALLIRYFIGTPTVVKHTSMYPTFKENERLIINRTYRITKRKPKVGEIITFEAPTKEYTKWDAKQSNPIAIYDKEPKGIFNKFVYYCLEMTKTSYIKRVIAVEGQHVKIENSKVIVNDIVQEEEYLNDDVVTESDVFYDFIVPEGYVFAMGDNRSNSIDCRVLGCIPLEKIEGIVVMRFWPLSRFSKF